MMGHPSFPRTVAARALHTHLAQPTPLAVLRAGIAVGDQQQLAMGRLVVGKVQHGGLAAAQVRIEGLVGDRKG